MSTPFQPCRSAVGLRLLAAGQSAQAALAQLLATKNARLKQPPKTQVAAALKAVQSRAKQLKLEAWIRVQATGREINLQVDEVALAQASQLDGCYVIKTDLLAAWATTGLVHDRYKDLALVEQNFRTSKTVALELRPVQVRLEASTRGHALVVMLAHRYPGVATLLGRGEFDGEEGLKQLSSLCVTEVIVHGVVKDQLLPEPRPQVKKLPPLPRVELPKQLRYTGRIVPTKKNLKQSRSNHCL